MIRSSLMKWAAAAVLALPVVPAFAARAHRAAHRTAPHTAPLALASHTTATHTAPAAAHHARQVVHHRSARHVGHAATKHRAIHHTLAKHVRTHRPAVTSKWAPPATTLSASRAALRTGAIARSNTSHTAATTLSAHTTVPRPH